METTGFSSMGPLFDKYHFPHCPERKVPWAVLPCFPLHGSTYLRVGVLGVNPMAWNSRKQNPKGSYRTNCLVSMPPFARVTKEQWLRCACLFPFLVGDELLKQWRLALLLVAKQATPNIVFPQEGVDDEVEMTLLLVIHMNGGTHKSLVSFSFPSKKRTTSHAENHNNDIPMYKATI